MYIFNLTLCKWISCTALLLQNQLKAKTMIPSILNKLLSPTASRVHCASSGQGCDIQNKFSKLRIKTQVNMHGKSLHGVRVHFPDIFNYYSWR